MIRIREIKIRVDLDQESSLKNWLFHKFRIQESALLSLKIYKRSIDARDTHNVYYVYDVYVELEDEKKFYKYFNKNIFLEEYPEYSFPIQNVVKNKVIIVGSGPAGLFCAYFLAKSGVAPIIIERGKKVEERIKDVEEFWENGSLNPESNVQFGEGGAGTFSDGKLNTLVKDKEKRMQAVLKIFVECGAPQEILFDHKPHIGTDILRKVILNLRENIIKMGGIFLYETLLTDLLIQENKIVGIEVNHAKTIVCDKVVLAIGHSARDTFEMLYHKGIEMCSKPFAIGVRVEHRQTMINQTQYGNFAKYLSPASYKLTYKAHDGRGVYSFCMCPGGYVVNSSSQSNRICVNGMSNFARESENANSAIIVTVDSNDFGQDPLAGLNYQKRLEELTYQLSNGKIPTQRWEDFLRNKKTENYGKIKPVHKGETIMVNLNDILPDFLICDLKEAMQNFGKKIPGFDDKDVLISAIESRTSSPIKIIRDSKSLMSNIKNVFPCGEGSGYAGGITTSAIDGIKVAESIIDIN